MSEYTHDVFFSYARADNDADSYYFVARLHDLTCKESQAFTAREPTNLLETEAIDVFG